MDLQEVFDFVNSIVDKAGEVMEEGFYGTKTVEQKAGPWDLVTDYDKKVEAFIIDSIKAKYPNHKFMAEESAVAGKKFELSDEPTWLIDPIDGTYNYAHGFPETCISVALSVESTVVLGIVYNPLHKAKYTAIKGKGAFVNGRPIAVSKTPRLQDSLVSFELAIIRFPQIQERSTKRFLEVTHMSHGVRILGSAALSLCMVAQGGIDVFFHEHLKPWDLAAGCLILQEAGGYATHQHGEPYDVLIGNIVATANKQIADDVLEIFKKYP